MGKQHFVPDNTAVSYRILLKRHTVDEPSAGADIGIFRTVFARSQPTPSASASAHDRQGGSVIWSSGASAATAAASSPAPLRQSDSQDRMGAPAIARPAARSRCSCALAPSHPRKCQRSGAV
jgi:hypothetical protein